MTDNDIATLADVGFAPEKAAEALQCTHGNCKEAINVLLDPKQSGGQLMQAVAVAQKVDKKLKQSNKHNETMTTVGQHPNNPSTCSGYHPERVIQTNSGDVPNKNC